MGLLDPIPQPYRPPSTERDYDRSKVELRCGTCGVKLTVENCYTRFSNLLCKPHYNEYKNNQHRANGWKARKKYEKKNDKTDRRRKQHLETQKRMREKYPEKFAARVMLRLAVRAGKVEKKPCVICGETRSEGHHPDYSKPLEVVWLCKHHHELTHHS